MGKFDSCVDKGILVGYSSTRKSYKYYNLRLNKVVEIINIKFDETGRPNQRKKKTNQWNNFLKKKMKKKKNRKEKVQQVSPKTPSK